MKPGLLFIIVSVLISCTPIQPQPDSTAISRALALVDQGVIYLRSGALERAESSFAVAYELAFLPQALDGLGCVALHQKNYTRAEYYFLQVKQRFPEYRHVDGNIAALYQQLGRPDLAQGWYVRALENNADNFRFRNNFGVLLAEKNAHRMALEQFGRAEVLVNDSVIYDNKQVLKGSGVRIDE